jgi:hypothetical protein
MRNLAFIFLTVFSFVLSAYRQTEPENSDKRPFKFDISLDAVGQSFEDQTLLGDAYGGSFGYRFSMHFSISGYPGLGIFSGRQWAGIDENAFLGGFRETARIPEMGAFIFHNFPLTPAISLNPEIGFGSLSIIQGQSPSRFILNYLQFFGNLGLEYHLYEFSNRNQIALQIKGGYQLFSGKNIVINTQDRNFVQQSSAFQLGGGVKLKF